LGFTQGPINRAGKAITKEDIHVTRHEYNAQRWAEELRLETLYHLIETAFGAVKGRMASGSPLTNTDHEAIVAFAAAQLIRTPKFRGSWRFTGPGVNESQLNAISSPLLRTGIEKTLANIAANQSQILSFISLWRATEVLGTMRMTLLKTDD
jgi:hypothetical protein